MAENKLSSIKSLLIFVIILFAFITALIIVVYLPAFKNYSPVVVQPTVEPTPVVDISDWKTYRNEDIGFEIKYPVGWYLYSDSPSDIFIQPNEEIPESVPGPYASALGIKIITIKAGSDLLQLIKPEFGQDGINFTKELLMIGGTQGLKIISICDGFELGCGTPHWFVAKENILYHFDSNLGYNKTFDQILFTFEFTK
ncbi:MAG: hypothetical protein Q8N37_02675 [bacterium]|nr:hypothetical protein [bacterium]